MIIKTLNRVTEYSALYHPEMPVKIILCEIDPNNPKRTVVIGEGYVTELYNQNGEFIIKGVKSVVKEFPKK